MSGIAQRLQAFDFVQLFNELGWEQLRVGVDVEIDSHLHALQPVAEKKGVQVLRCKPGPDGDVPPYAVRQKIERKVTPDVREHLIIFTDAACTRQIWQWVARAPGRPTQYREVKWQLGQSTELLEQKLKTIAFDLNEEESLTVFGVAERLRGGFDRDTVTKKFYTRFKDQRDAFQNFIRGIPVDDHARWYTAVVIDRLMFLWFLQEKGFLNNEKRYLRNRLESHIAANPQTSFYKAFLCPLFFSGFAEERTEANRTTIERDFGKVPYLNGGLFAEHELEREYGEAIDIPDSAFAALFEFFDQWDWHLDDRPLASGREIDPEVLGYIFEKFVNQKQMGAYYTKEDITEYIAKNTVIPCLFEKVRADHATAFDAHAWALLQEEPRRYIYPAMLHGVDEPYPPEIATGLDAQAPNLLERRKPWNKPAAPSHALPTEIWRETIARHQRAREILAKLQTGEVRGVADLITYNLNIRQFAQDVIERCSDPALIRAFWVALAGRLPRKSNEKFRHGLSVLDPTCGSGAFLFAALQVLRPLYQACLTTMSGLLADESIQGRALGEKWKDIEEIVERFHAHDTDRQRDYSVLKHIIVHNLYGVDIEAQATEIAKLRLFLKLVALLEPGDDIEPLPDIDFNIRAGNTLVGYASAEETEKAVRGTIGGQIATQGNLFSDAWGDIRIRLTAVEQAYNNFQIQQVQRGGHVTVEDKCALGDQLHELEETLNQHLCHEYGKDPYKAKDYAAWKSSHKPFHWYVDFYPIMAAGGFDVVIGNPPYLEYSKVSEYTIRNYVTESCGNLYAFTVERSFALCQSRGQTGMIVPISVACSGATQPLRDILHQTSRSIWLSHYSNRPAQLFSGAQNRLTVYLASGQGSTPTYCSTRYYRWDGRNGERGALFPTLRYQPTTAKLNLFHGLLPKVGDPEAVNSLFKIRNNKVIRLFASKKSQHILYWVRVPGYFCQFTLSPPMAVPEVGGIPRIRGEVNEISFADRENRNLIHAVLNSSTYYLFFCAYTDTRHINPSDVADFPVDLNAFTVDVRTKLDGLSARLEACFTNNTIKWRKSGLIIDSINAKSCKPVLDEIDTALAEHYGFSAEELDYIINYDVKYRMGLNGEEADADD